MLRNETRIETQKNSINILVYLDSEFCFVLGNIQDIYEYVRIYSGGKEINKSLHFKGTFVTNSESVLKNYTNTFFQLKTISKFGTFTVFLSLYRSL